MNLIFNRVFRALGCATSLMVVIFLLPISASAQNGFNLFQTMRTLILAPPTLLSGGTAVPSTNNWVDLHGLDGMQTVTISTGTNSIGNLKCTLETSADKTNLVAITNFALATQTDVAITNYYWGSTNLFATNTYLLPGTIQTPTSYSAGFASTYVLPAQFTNGFPLTVGAKALYQIAFPISAASRYIRIYWEGSGTGTNAMVSAILQGLPGSSVPR
jgi:hypothetical protein